MKVGIPREIKNHEYRVAITPAGVNELVRNGHEVFIEKDAGVGSSIPDEDYVDAGAKILDTADDVWAEGDLLLKVKEPIAEEYGRMRADQTLFTYLHLAADKACTDALLASGTTGDRLRDRAAARRLAAAAGPDVRGRRPAGPAGRRVPPDASGRRPRRADRRRARRLRGQGRRHRRRRLRPERGRDRARHAGRGAAAGPQRRPAAPDGRHLPGPLPDHRLQRLRGRAGRAGRRPGHRRGAGRRRQGARSSSATSWCRG